MLKNTKGPILKIIKRTGIRSQKQMKIYELTYIISPDVASEEAEAKAKELESAITGRQGLILKQSNPVAKALSYPIKKRASGFLGSLEFQLEPESLLELKEIIGKDSAIARYMVIIKEPAKPKKERRSKERAEAATAAASRIEASPTPEEREEPNEPEEKEKAPEPSQDQKSKVELKDIEETLDELLGE